MKRHLPRTLLLAALTAIGCQQKATQAPPEAPTPVVPVSHPVEREVTDYVDYTGRTDSAQSVSVRARVTGYLMSMPFEEGAEVKEGDLLFEIDPRPYQAVVEQAQSQVTLMQAQYKLAKITYDRDRLAQRGDAVSAQQLDQDRAAIDEADARIKAAQATLDAANLNLDFTKVKAYIDGRISRYYYTVGNLVTQDQTLLTTIMGMDPLYVYFDMEERTFQKLVKNINLNPKDPKGSKTEIPVTMALEGEEGFPHRGKINFINNQVNPSTGTIAVRGVFENKRPEGGTWTMVPGMFVRARLPVGAARKSLLVVDRAIGSDQGLKFVYVVDGENKVQYRRVTTGPLQEDGLRVIEDGVKPDDWVVVGGLQQLRPRTVVQPDQVSMPTPGSDAPSSPRRKPQPPAPGEKREKGAK
jgi:multidrug efflux system membrane fusion protein